MMRIAVMQPYIFPYIGYIQLMAAVDRFVFLDDVTYINKGWINRNRILVNGKEHLFTIPLTGASQNKFINSIQVLDDGKWKQKFLRTIEMAYRKSPAFAEVYPVISDMILINKPVLSHYIADGFRLLNPHLGINTELLFSSEIDTDSPLKAQSRIISICKLNSADVYINPIGGTELYRNEDFEQAGVELNFIKTDAIEYRQSGSDFVPWLSVVDVLMYNGFAGVRAMLSRYTLVKGS